MEKEIILKKLEIFMNTPYRYEVGPYTLDGERGWYGRFTDFPHLVVYVDNQEEVYEELMDLKREWGYGEIEAGHKIPEPEESESVFKEYSGRITLRVSKSFHKTLSNNAEREKVSLNLYINELLQTGLSKQTTGDMKQTILEEVSKVVKTYQGFAKVNTEYNGYVMSNTGRLIDTEKYTV